MLFTDLALVGIPSRASRRADLIDGQASLLAQSYGALPTPGAVRRVCLRIGSRLVRLEEGAAGVLAELGAQIAESAELVAEAFRCLGHGQIVHEVRAKSLVLAMGGIGRL